MPSRAEAAGWGWEIRRHPTRGWIAIMRCRGDAMRVVSSRWRITLLPKAIDAIWREARVQDQGR